MILDMKSYVALHSWLVFVPAMILALTVRGFARAFGTKKQGDYTAENYGFLSLNPAVHVDAISCVVIATFVVLTEFVIQNQTATTIFIITFMFIFGGRMVNQVPINSYNFKNGTRSYALVAISGPIGNLILSLVCFYMISIAGYFNLQPYMINTISTFCIFTAQVSAFFATIEMIPIPPLDGFKVFEYFYPSKANSWSDFLGPWSLPLVFVVIFAPGFNDLLWTIIRILLTVIRFFVFI